MIQPHEIDWREAKRILDFVQGTKTHGIHYVAKYDLELVGFTDSDWECDSTNRKIIFGYVFMLVDGPISWSIEKKSAIAISSTEIEYRGVVNATTNYLWLQGILGESAIEYDTSIVIYCENQSTIQISTYPIERQ